ncbi:MAG TPA: hypothetical protein VI111_06700, partial [Thermoleophilaceae bacterium]
MLKRLPIESSQSVVILAVARLALALVAVTAVLVLGPPYHGRGLAVIAGVLLPWSVAMLLLARRNPDAALSPLVAAGDVVVLTLLEVTIPQALGAIRLVAMFLITAHAHFQGERRGVAIAAVGSTVLVAATAVRGETNVGGNVLTLY